VTGISPSQVVVNPLSDIGRNVIGAGTYRTGIPQPTHAVEKIDFSNRSGCGIKNQKKHGMDPVARRRE
jgi:hypothetical protein